MERFTKCVATQACARAQKETRGAFCKPQASVHKHYGGLFSNCPALTAEDRHERGWLALGNECPTIEYFGASGDKVASGQPLPVFTNGEPVTSSHETFLPEPAASSSQQEQREAMHDPLPSTSGLQQQDRKVCSVLQTGLFH